MFRLLIKVALLTNIVCLFTICAVIVVVRNNKSYSESLLSKYSWALQNMQSRKFTLVEMSALLDEDKGLMRDDGYGCWWTKSDPECQICLNSIIRENEIEESDAISFSVGNNKMMLGEAIKQYGEPIDYSLNGEYITLNLESNIGVTAHLPFDSSKTRKQQNLRIDPTLIIDNLHYPGSFTKAHDRWRGFIRLVFP